VLKANTQQKKEKVLFEYQLILLIISSFVGFLSVSQSLIAACVFITRERKVIERSGYSIMVKRPKINVIWC